MTNITVKVFKQTNLIHPGYGRWFYEVARNGRIIKSGGGHCDEQRVRRDLSSWARYSNLRGEEAYAVDCGALPTYGNDMPRASWAELGEVEKYSWEKLREGMQ